MIALDTNVLVRFLVQDDQDQARVASAAIERLTEDEPGFVCREVMVELVWVLERAYRLDRPRIAGALDGLLSAIELVVEGSDDVAPALELYRNDGFDFADLMIAAAARRAGTSELLTFDKRAARLPNVRMLQR